ncbi:3-hydroxybutyryl-CoA dehydrogenase [Piscinibacter sp.]|uniref:3-hydroxybutyryl-CoA dehydrogenase n=1 Tax=Piscinibacter sp. TaxID=1903157 RepID=UPI002F422E1F
MNLTHVGIVGAGQMGSGIAQVCAAAGLDVSLVDVSDAALDRGIAAIAAGFERQVKKGTLSADAQAAMLSRIRTATDHRSLEGSGIVIEAATENLELKLRILKQLSETVAPHAVIASNTSSISITQLAAAVTAPERFIGIHFFNPVPLMGLVEVIRGLQTSDATAASAQAFAKTIGKTPVLVRNSPGFVVNRILVPMINEAVMVLQEGLATAEDIDNGMKLGCNHPIGPLALADLIGLDTVLAIMQVFAEEFGDPKYRPAPLLKEMVCAGRLGRKSKRGFYSYE